MATLNERRIGAIVGALVADAAAEPLHWIYNDDTLQSLIQGKEDIEFMSPSANPFYHVEVGDHSCYGDQELVILRDIVACKGIDTNHLKKTIFEHFGPDSVYDKAAKEKEKTGAKRLNGPYRNGCMKEFLQNYQDGKENAASESDAQMDCVIRVIPAVALYAGRPEMLQKVEELVRVSHKSPVAISCAILSAKLLEFYIVNGKSANALEDIQAKLTDEEVLILSDVLDNKDKQHVEVAKSFGRACSVPGAFKTAVHGVINAKDFVSGVRATCRAGGGNCSRSGYIGACMGAQYGMDTIPETWRSRTKHFEEIKNLANELINML